MGYLLPESWKELMEETNLLFYIVFIVSCVLIFRHFLYFSFDAYKIMGLDNGK